MAQKNNVLSYTLATIASLCFVSGLLVITGGEPSHGKTGTDSAYDRKHA